MDASMELLVKQAQRGNTKAFAALYEEIYLDLYKFALYTMKQPHEAEDAVSEAVISAFEKIGMLRKPRSFKSWMFQILINQCRKKLNAEKSLENREELLDDASILQTPDTALSLREALAQLGDQERMIICLSVFGGYKSNEIGEQMGLPAATVRSKLSRGLQKMRKFLGEEEST